MPRFLVKVVVEAEINGLLEATDLTEARVRAASEPLETPLIGTFKRTTLA
jgi:hypothetical protein